MITLADGLTALLAESDSVTVRAQVIDRLQEEGADVEATLLAWVIAHKSNDGPRLAYADWREMQGDSDRAEFIRVQCKIARKEPIIRGSDECYCGFLNVGEPACVVCQKRSEEVYLLKNRSQRLLKSRPWEWVAPPGNTGFSAGSTWVHRCEWIFVRGFVGDISCSAIQWLRHADEIARRHPISRLRLGGLIVPGKNYAKDDVRFCISAPTEGADYVIQNAPWKPHESPTLREMFTVAWPDIAVEYMSHGVGGQWVTAVATANP